MLPSYWCHHLILFGDGLAFVEIPIEYSYYIGTN